MSQASDWAGALWDGLTDLHPSISIVKLTVIGYHCNHLDGQLNYQASAFRLIGVTVMYQIWDW